MPRSWWIVGKPEVIQTGSGRSVPGIRLAGSDHRACRQFWEDYGAHGSNALVRDVRLRSCKKFNFLPAWNRVFRQEIRLTPIKLHSQKLAEMRCINDSGGHSRSPASSTKTQ